MTRPFFNVLAVSFAAATAAMSACPALSTPAEEPAENSVCPLIEAAAKTQNLPVVFLTRLIWQESSFRAHAVSPAGAQGIAQFMPGTADDWKLADPFDPAEAIPKAAELLASLRQRFGNLGLAAAAYNAGANRVANWIGGHGGLPIETRDYVLTITRKTVEDWNAPNPEAASPDTVPSASCLEVAALIRKSEPHRFAGSMLTAPWGVQLAGSFSKRVALASYARASASLHNVIGDVEPMILSGRVRSRGFSPFFRVRVPASSRAAASLLCNKILHAGGACAVLRS
jgi:hypothetical protein